MKTKIHSTAFFSQRKSRVPKQIQFAFLVCLLIIAISCEKSNSSDVVFKATINGASQTPPNSSVATGAATLTYNKDTKIFSIVVTFSGLTATICSHS